MFQPQPVDNLRRLLESQDRDVKPQASHALRDYETVHRQWQDQYCDTATAFSKIHSAVDYKDALYWASYARKYDEHYWRPACDTKVAGASDSARKRKIHEIYEITDDELGTVDHFGVFDDFIDRARESDDLEKATYWMCLGWRLLAELKYERLLDHCVGSKRRKKNLLRAAELSSAVQNLVLTMKPLRNDDKRTLRPLTATSGVANTIDGIKAWGSLAHEAYQTTLLRRQATLRITCAFLSNAVHASTVEEARYWIKLVIDVQNEPLPSDMNPTSAPNSVNLTQYETDTSEDRFLVPALEAGIKSASSPLLPPEILIMIMAAADMSTLLTLAEVSRLFAQTFAARHRQLVCSAIESTATGGVRRCVKALLFVRIRWPAILRSPALGYGDAEADQAGRHEALYSSLRENDRPHPLDDVDLAEVHSRNLLRSARSIDQIVRDIIAKRIDQGHWSSCEDSSMCTKTSRLSEALWRMQLIQEAEVADCQRDNYIGAVVPEKYWKTPVRDMKMSFEVEEHLHWMLSTWQTKHKGIGAAYAANLSRLPPQNRPQRLLCRCTKHGRYI